MSDSEFEDYIDNLVPEELQNEAYKALGKEASFIDIVNMQERLRVHTIKNLISSTHNWDKCLVSHDDGLMEECFWCNDCNVKCSVFEHINCLSIISRVKDKLPTYTKHNQFLMFTCDQLRNFETPTDYGKHCYQCGVPERAKTSKCTIVGC